MSHEAAVSNSISQYQGIPAAAYRSIFQDRRLGVSDSDSTSPTRTTSAAVISAPRGRHRRKKKSGVKKLDLSAAKKTSVFTPTTQHGGSSASLDRSCMARRAFDSRAFRI